MSDRPFSTVQFAAQTCADLRDEIQREFPRQEVVVVQMRGPIMNFVGHELIAKSVRYNPMTGPFKLIVDTLKKNEIETINKGLMLKTILVGLYVYNPEDSIVRYALKTIY